MDEINGPVERISLVPKKGGRKPLYVIEDLEVGESRLIAAPPRNVRAAISPRAKALGFRIRTASEGDGCRVCRVG